MTSYGTCQTQSLNPSRFHKRNDVHVTCSYLNTPHSVSISAVSIKEKRSKCLPPVPKKEARRYTLLPGHPRRKSREVPWKLPVKLFVPIAVRLMQKTSRPTCPSRTPLPSPHHSAPLFPCRPLPLLHCPALPRIALPTLPPPHRSLPAARLVVPAASLRLRR